MQLPSSDPNVSGKRGLGPIYRCALSACLAGVLLACQVGIAHAAIVNGDFEAEPYTYNPPGWTASGVFITEYVCHDQPYAGVDNGTSFALFNFDEPRELTNNTLSQTAVASGTSLAFSWSRLRSSYLGNGGATFQLAYQDITTGGTMTTLDIDRSPDGFEPSGDQTWRQVSVPGLTIGDSYYIEFRAGLSAGVTPDISHTVYYMVDDVSFTTVPEPSTIVLLAIGAATLAFTSHRRKRHS
jgi:hypothetical protein